MLPLGEIKFKSENILKDVDTVVRLKKRFNFPEIWLKAFSS